ncbi:MAG: glycosyltransferase [Bacteroidetes bacterium]|nr:glycosyltransferase [Bacteroidota bacterium]MBP7398135.1 glycosyltransferase [Chitinophagales bacterium]MBP8753121.1 glycosyltransferase [Chitinophagales bacterium]MBP9189110.1 glycosyltransferase [Chitinophagales bacterium]MBP9548149.1 glycosyltransferase [Chitinophagales bacterium]
MEKILILTPGFPIDEQDDVCIPFLQDYVLALEEKIGKENIHVISFQYPFDKGEYLWNGIKIYSAGGNNRKGILKLITWNRVMRKAKEWIQPGKTILHIFWLNETTLIGAKLSKKYDCKIIATIMGQDILAENNYLNKIPLNTIHVVAPNTKAAETFKKNTGNNVQAIIRPGVKNISAIQQERNIDLLFVGAFIALKQPEICIEIVNQLNKEFPNLNCKMIGDGILQEKCIATSQNLEIKNIQFTGKLDRKKIFEYMQQSKVLVHTSYYEGHATVFEEAIASGMQVVCFDVGRPEHHAVHVCAEKKEMCCTISHLLKKDYNNNQLTSYSITQTVEFYQQLYTTH